MVLDHLAVAVASWSDATDVLVGALRGRWRYGIRTPAFNPCQVGYGNDTRIELLAPPERGSSFVTKFLAAGTNRPHHITFKTTDIRAVLRDAERFGVAPVLVSLENPGWREGFLHPRDTGLGVLIQVAQGDGDPTKSLPPDLLVDCPRAESGDEPSAISHIIVRVSDTEWAARLFCEVLHGERVVVTDDMVRLRWPSGADLLLLGPDRGSEPPLPLGVRSIGFDATAPPDLALTPVGMGWSKTQVVPALGLSLLFNSV
ncbi:VOC family protein [Dactylosporangium sp. NPDC000555]|uniref:VOC family protein n=1 Tax=Dactylosporangium sp. NPDC000555 TaxID=3154260 RepID=UPI0033342268